jgi:tetratricopeptide (TPR) repeat protein
MGRKPEATAIMKKALPYGNQLEVYGYGVSLITAKEPKEAFEIFKMNYSKNPNTLFTNIGMASGYSALGDFKNALAYAQKALLLAKGGNKLIIENNIKDLQSGKDMND